jgi:glycosyltransferase involved in cell wall biosynthesis
MPTVSIGMPVYNGATFIRESLDSLLAQSFTDFELIISDNGSIDHTEAICREYAQNDTRVRYIRHDRNHGACANFKFVFNKSVGKYFMWAAADDVWDRFWIETLLPVCEKYQCLAYGTVVSIDSNNRYIFNLSSGRSFNFSGNKYWRKAKYFFAMPRLGKANPIYGLLPREILQRACFAIFEDEGFGSDMIFLYDLLSLLEIRRPSSVVRLLKRIHTGSSEFPIFPNRNKFSNLPLYFKNFAAEALQPFKLLLVYAHYSSPIETIGLAFLTLPMSLRNIFVMLKLAKYYLLNKSLHNLPEAISS